MVFQGKGCTYEECKNLQIVTNEFIIIFLLCCQIYVTLQHDDYYEIGHP